MSKMEFQVREILNQYSDDTEVPSSLIWDLVAQSRSTAIKNALNGRHVLSETYFSTIPCMEMEMVSDTLCCDLGFETDCKLIRTKKELPEIITVNFGKAFISIGPSLLSKERFSYATYERIFNLGETKFTKQIIYAFDFQNWLFLFSRGNKKVNLIEKIMVRFIAANPMDLINYACEDLPCFTVESPYPIDLWMWQTLVKPHVLSELSIKLGVPMDTDNNAKDDTLNSGAKSPKIQSEKEPQQ